jgi:preprotein translocase subunit YajC
MSNSKSAIQEIKKLMVQFGFMAEETTPLSFKLVDDTILQTEKLEAGKEIHKINEAFEKVVLEDGSYRLVENFEIEVKEGKIETVREIFVEAKLADGTVIKVEGDNLAEGAKVVVVQEDAEVPAPDGVHELEDGTKVETKDGIIVKVEEVAGDVEEGETPEAPELEVPSLAMDQEMIQMLQDFIKKMGEKMCHMESQFQSLNTEFNSFKKEPAAKKIADGKTEKFNKEEDEIDAKLAMIMSLRKNNK